jgi:cell division protein FtsL
MNTPSPKLTPTRKTGARRAIKRGEKIFICLLAAVVLLVQLPALGIATENAGGGL